MVTEIERQILMIGTVVIAPSTLTDQDIIDAVRALRNQPGPDEMWIPVNPSWIKRWEERRLWWPRFVETTVVLVLLGIALMIVTGGL